MSVTIYGHHDDDAVFEDDNGPARVPLRALAMLHHAADMGSARPAQPADSSNPASRHPTPRRGNHSPRSIA